MKISNSFFLSFFFCIHFETVNCVIYLLDNFYNISCHRSFVVVFQFIQFPRHSILSRFCSEWISVFHSPSNRRSPNKNSLKCHSTKCACIWMKFNSLLLFILKNKLRKNENLLQHNSFFFLSVFFGCCLFYFVVFVLLFFSAYNSKHIHNFKHYSFSQFFHLFIVIHFFFL